MKQLVLGEDLVGHFLRAAEEERAGSGRLRLVGRERHGDAPASLVVVGHPAGFEVRVRDLDGLAVGGRQEAWRADGYLELGRVMAGLRGRLTVQVDERREPVVVAADDGQCQREVELGGSHHGGRRPADRHPHRQFPFRLGVHVGVVQRRAGGALPGDGILFAEPEQEVELVGEELGVIVQVVAEEGERLDVRAASGDDLGPAAGDEVEGGELLEDAHRVVGAEDRHSARQLDITGAGGHGCQHDSGGRYREVAAVMLSDREDVEANLIRYLGLLDQFPEPEPGVGGRWVTGSGDSSPKW